MIFCSYFIKQRTDFQLDGAGDWHVYTEEHAKQADSVSCGVYVLRVIGLVKNIVNFSVEDFQEFWQKILYIVYEKRTEMGVNVKQTSSHFQIKIA